MSASAEHSGDKPHANGGRSLASILDEKHGDSDVEDREELEEEEQEDEEEHEVPAGLCVECEDQPAEIRCETCADNFCDVCFHAQHRKGSRKRHATTPLAENPRKRQQIAQSKPAANGGEDDEDMEDAELDDELEKIVTGAPTTSVAANAQPELGAAPGEWFVDRAKFIPVRLTLGERKMLRLLDAALQVSEYTDKIDTIGYGLSRAKRIVHQIRELCSILSGLMLAADYKRGQELFEDRDFVANETFFQRLFEIGRRHKIQNPDKMRTTYGKLMYLLQDSQTPEVKDLLGFSCVIPIKTVYAVLEEHNAVDMLRDPLMTAATQEIGAGKRSRREIQKDIKAKERAIELLSSRYTRGDLDQEEVRQMLYSIGDNHAFLRVNRDPCEKMIEYLKEYFSPSAPKDKKGRDSLAIKSGKGGARLSHDHSKQYIFVLQSLTLWREVLHDLFHLWSLGEQDLLMEGNYYRLRDTGQGLNRVQNAPKTSRMMHSILGRAQKTLGGWVGSSVIHMGDHNVPNAFMFIDKYSQIYRILFPITTTLSKLPDLYAQHALRSYIDSEYGSLDNLYLEILGDFFRHAFDGSGADNFFDAGSCIDGRLTSAWNWCSTLEKKRYFHIFLLTGFVGFDGEW